MELIVSCPPRLHRLADSATSLLLVSGTDRCSGQGCTATFLLRFRYNQKYFGFPCWQRLFRIAIRMHGPEHLFAFIRSDPLLLQLPRRAPAGARYARPPFLPRLLQVRIPLD
jgi:hypothetical protein